MKRYPCWLVLLACLAAVGVGSAAARADDWPQWLGPLRDGVWRETGIVAKFPAGGPKVKWRVPVGGGYAGPAVAHGRVFVMDRVLAKGTRNPANPFSREGVPGTERMRCFNEADGKLLWEHEYDCPYRISYPAGPRCTPTVDGDRVYALGAMGDLKCHDVKTGNVLWSRDFKADFKGTIEKDGKTEVVNLEPAVWGWSAAPLVDGDKLICLVGGEGSIVVAFDKLTGKERWRALSAKEPGYCPPMIFTLAGVRQLIIWHPEAVNSLDPETGKVYWTQPFQANAGLSIPTPRVLDNHLFVTAFYNGPLMLEVTNQGKPSAKVAWKGKSTSEQPSRTDGLHAIMCTPWIQGDHIYGVCSYGELRCLEARTGKRLWSTLKATTVDGRPTRWANAFIIPHEDRYFLFNERGELIIARLTPQGYEEIDRAKILEPTLVTAGREYVWTHPAFANRCMLARNDKELVCVSLAKE